MTTSGWKLKLVTPPAVEPLTLAEAKAHCQVTISDDDDLISGFIKSAREYAENFTRRALVLQTWDLGLDSLSGYAIQIPKSPLVDVVSITYTDDDGNAETLATTEYEVDDFSEPAMIYRTRNATWPYLTVSGTRARVRFRAGYLGNGSPGDGAENVPESIKTAIKLMVAHNYENREAVITGTIANELPLGVDNLLHPYRVYGWN